MDGDFTKLPRHLREAVNAELAAGERILFTSRPDWRAEAGSLFFLLLFGIFWSAISLGIFGIGVGGLTGLITPMSGGRPAGTGMLAVIALFSFPFVAIGGVLLAAPFLGVRKARNTVHVITDERVLNVYVGRDKGAQSFPFSKINFVKRRDRRNGSGSLEIGYGVEHDGDGDPRPLTFDWSGIRGAKRAEELIREYMRTRR
jgi:hypothetical protein